MKRGRFWIVIGNWDRFDYFDILDCEPLGFWIRDVFAKADRLRPGEEVSIIIGNFTQFKDGGRSRLRFESDTVLQEQQEVYWLKHGRIDQIPESM